MYAVTKRVTGAVQRSRGKLERVTTTNTYAHVLPETRRQAVEGIDKLLGDEEADDE